MTVAARSVTRGKSRFCFTSFSASFLWGRGDESLWKHMDGELNNLYLGLESQGDGSGRLANDWHQERGDKRSSDSRWHSGEEIKCRSDAECRVWRSGIKRVKRTSHLALDWRACSSSQTQKPLCLDLVRVKKNDLVLTFVFVFVQFLLLVPGATTIRRNQEKFMCERKEHDNKWLPICCKHRLYKLYYTEVLL